MLADWPDHGWEQAYLASTTIVNCASRVTYLLWICFDDGEASCVLLLYRPGVMGALPRPDYGSEALGEAFRTLA